MASFISWQVSPLKAQARDQTVAGRLLASMSVQIQDIANPADTRTGAGDFELMGPGDVARLAPGIISRRFPAPGAIDAEESKAALVEFAGDALLDLPWRYTPEKDRPTVSGGRGIRPWLVLVVGRAGELVLSPDGAVTVAPSVQAKHLLSGSWRWAHIHEVDGVRTARLLCPADLIANSTYIAALVPAFTVEQDGTLHDSWPLAGGGAVRLACYDSWSFRTGPEGDFAQLAAKLRAASPAEIGPAFGRAALRYDRRGSGTPSSVDLAAGGALQLPPGSAPLPDPVPAWVADEIAALAKPIATPDRRWVLTSPRYHEPFLPPATPPASGGAANSTPIRAGAAPPVSAPMPASPGRIGSSLPRQPRPATSRSPATGSAMSRSASKRPVHYGADACRPIRSAGSPCSARCSAGCPPRAAVPCSTRSADARR